MEMNYETHPKVPTKQLIREVATILPTLVLTEFGTSSRCAACKSPEKLRREFVSTENNATNHGIVVTTTAPQVSTGGNNQTKEKNDCLDTNKALSDKDTRREVCSNCKRVWLHDEVSVHNLAHVARAILLREERPAWLKRQK